MASTRLRRTVLITAISSLLLHLMLLIFFATQYIQSPPQQAQLIFADSHKNPPIPLHHQISSPVTLAARTAREFAFDPSRVKQLGLPYAPPEETSLDANNDPKEQITDQNQQTIHQHQPTTPAPNSQPDIPTPTASLQQVPQQNSPETPPLLPHSKKESTEIPTSTYNQKDTKLPPISPDTPKIPQSSETQLSKPASPSNENTTATLPSQQQPPSIKKPTPPIQHTKPPLTAAQLTSGFLAHLQNQDGDSALTIRGETRSRKPTAQELLLERYCEKIAHCIQSSHAAQSNNRPRIISTIDIENTIVIVYNKKNKQHSVHPLSLSGHKEFDDYCLFITNDARSAFPPAPASLQTDGDSLAIAFISQVHATNQGSSMKKNWFRHRP